MHEYSIRSVTSISELNGIVEVQRQAWNMVDLEIVPSSTLKAITSFGTVLIAVDKLDKVIGFILAFPNFPDRHYSDMMAILPSWQGKGIGFALKKYHREIALKSEILINSIVWTVDPLLTNNSYLNFSKLGGACSTYYSDYYGDQEGVGIYKGLPSDRFLIEWNIRSDKVSRRMNDYKVDRIDLNALLERSSPINLLENHRFVLKKSFNPRKSFSVEVPANFQHLKKEYIDIAKDWRLKFREICMEYFDIGWEISDFHSFLTHDIRRNYYEFTKKE